MPRLCIVYPGICLTTEEKSREKPQSGYTKGARLTIAECDSFSQLGHRGRWPRLACWLMRPLAFESGDGVNPRSAYLPSCHTRVFHTSAHLESKLTVGALMWSENNATPRSSCICLLLRTRGHQYQGRDTWIVVPVASGHGRGRRTSTRGTHNPS